MGTQFGKLLFVSSAFVLLVGCGSGYSSPTTATPAPAPAPSPSPAPANTVTVAIVSQNGAQSFSPNPASAAGRTVVFRNDDRVTHRIILNDGSIDTGNIAAGATSAPMQLPAAGGGYHCTIHPSMVGTIAN